MKSIGLILVFICFSIFYSTGQNIFWNDFQNTTIQNDNLIRVSGGKGFGSALSQNTIHNSSDWSAEYSVSFNAGVKVWGVIRPEVSLSIANMDIAAYFTNQEEGIITIFFQGETITNLEANANDILKFDKVGNYLYISLNGDIVFSTNFANSLSYNFVGMLEENTQFERMTFSTNYQKTFIVEFDTLTSRGDIQVTLPANSPAGPYHYLIGTDDYIDISQVYQSLLDSTNLSIDSSFFNANNNSTTHTFKNLEVGEYYISVLDDNEQLIKQGKVTINPRIDFFSDSDFNVEGDLFVAGKVGSYADLPMFLSNAEEAATDILSVEIINTVDAQYFGFGHDTVTMSGSQDILFGFLIQDQQAFTIFNGQVASEGVFIGENSILGIEYKKDIDDQRITYLINQEPIINNVSLNLQAYGPEPLFNLKFGFSKVGSVAKPILFNLGKKSNFYKIATFVSPIECDQTSGSVSIVFSTPNVGNYQVIYSTYSIYDESGNVVATGSPSNVNNLPPGNYTVQGVLVISKTYFFPSPIQFVFFNSIYETFTIGYPLNWINQNDTQYNNVNESLIRTSTPSSPSLGIGHATTNNEIVQNGESWVDFRIINKKLFSEIFEWSIISKNTVTFPFVDKFALSRTFTSNGLILYPSNSQTTIPYSSSDRYRIVYDANTIKLYRNYGLPILTLPANSPNYERLNVFLFKIGNLGVGSGIFDAYTNMPCFTPVLSFAKLQKEISGGYILSENDELKIYFEEDYSQLDTEYLEIKIYDFQRNEFTVTADKVYSYDDNRYTLDISGLNLQNESFYTLEITVDKDVKHYLKFKYKD